MSFITSPVVPNGKVDRAPVPAGEENKFFSAEEWNEGVCQSLLDLRSHVLDGYFGLVETASHPSVSGLSSTQLWAKTDGNLMFSRGATHKLVAAAPVTTRGDLVAFDGTNWQRLGRGSDGQVLVTDSGQSLGVKWATGGGGSGSVNEVDTGTGLTGGPITDTGTISLANTAVTPGTYSAANITVDQQGRITAAGDGAAGTTIGYVSVAALKAASSAGLVDGQRAHLDGYYARNDGGGGDFVYSTSSTAVEDGGLVLRPTDVGSGSPGRWLRQCNVGELNVRWYGAIGDGTSHPASGLGYGSLGALQAVYPHATSTSNEIDWLATEAAALQTQVYYPHSNGSGSNLHGGTVYVPYGFYYFDQAITPATNKPFFGLRFKGDGPHGAPGSAFVGGASWIMYTGAAARAFDFRSGDTIEVQDLTVWYNNASFAGKILFDCTWYPGINSDTGRVRFHRCAFAGDPGVFGAGEGAKAIISLHLAITCDIDQCAFGQAISHVRFQEYQPGFNVYSNKINCTRNSHSYAKWFYVNPGENITIDGCTMEGLGGFTEAGVADDVQRTVIVPATTFTVNAAAQTITLSGAGGKTWADLGFVVGMSPFLHDRNGRTVGPNNITCNPISLIDGAGLVMHVPGSGLVNQTNTWATLSAPGIVTGSPGAFVRATLGATVVFSGSTITRDNGSWIDDNWFVGDGVTIASALNDGSFSPITALTDKVMTIGSHTFIAETTSAATFYEQSAEGALTFTNNWCGDQFLPGSAWLRMNQPLSTSIISGNLLSGATRCIELNTGGTGITVINNTLSSLLCPVYVDPTGPGWGDATFFGNGVAYPLLDPAGQTPTAGLMMFCNGSYANDTINLTLAKATFNCLFKLGGDIDPAVSGTFLSYLLQMTQGGRSMALGADADGPLIQGFSALRINASDTYCGIGRSTLPTSTLDLGGAMAMPNAPRSTDFNVTWQTGTIMIDGTSNNVTATLSEAASTCPGRIHVFARTDSSGHTVKVTPVDGVDYTLTDANSRLIIQSDGTNYVKIMWR